MEVRRGFPQREKYEDVILTIGFYDGIHKGHQEIIRYVTGQAKRKKGKSCIITFSSHPSSFFSGRSLSLISTWEVDEAFLVYAMPTTYVLDRKGRVQKRHVGFNPATSPARLEKDVLEVLGK